MGRDNARCPNQTWDFTAGRLVVHFGHGTKTEEWTYKVDPSATPRTIDLKMTAGIKAGATARGVYEVKGDVLRICFNGDGGRPKELSVAALGDSRFGRYVILKRARPEKK